MLQNNALNWAIKEPLLTINQDVLRQSQTPPMWLSEIWSFRGYVLYNNGQRPQFRVAEDDYSDVDVTDFYCYHILAYRDSQLVGCIRLLPLSNFSTGFTESCFGANIFKKVLEELIVEKAEVLEGGRWLTHPDHRTCNEGKQLVSAAASLAKYLGYRIILSSTGTKDRQHLILIRLGFKPVSSVKPFYNEAFFDTLQMMCFELLKAPPHFERMMDVMSIELGLEEKTKIISSIQS
jgi:predicted GNAT family N-acyltransferase